MKRCGVCGCIIENDSNDICEVCKDDMGESNVPDKSYIDTDMAYSDFVMKRFLGVR